MYEQPFPTEIKIMKKRYFPLVLYRVNFSNLFVVNQMNVCNTSLKSHVWSLKIYYQYPLSSYIGQKKKTYPIRVGYLIKSSRFGVLNFFHVISFWHSVSLQFSLVGST